MNKPIMFYYQALVERKMLVEEYNQFTDLLNSPMRDSSHAYDENEKIVYLFKQTLGESIGISEEKYYQIVQRGIVITDFFLKVQK